MTGRSKLLLTLASGTIVTALVCATAPITSAVGPGPCPAAGPCSPDGACLPKCDTWGWYPTRWRAFPGDVVGPAPTAADATDAPTTPETDLRGPQLPDSTKESLIGPEKPERRGEAPAAAAGAPAVGPEPAAAPAQPPAAAPGAAQPEVELPGLPALPGTEQPPAGLPGPGTADDPFSALPPAPPWMVAPAEATAAADQASTYDADVAPAVEFEPAAVSPQQQESSNLHSDDAPPEMPASLIDALTGVPRRQAAPTVIEPPADARFAELPPAPPSAQLESAPAAMPLALPPVAPAIRLAQPASVVPTQSTAVGPTGRIVPASANATPGNAPLINPAVALVGDGPDDASEPAVYYEASDLPSTPSVRHAAP